MRLLLISSSTPVQTMLDDIVIATAMTNSSPAYRNAQIATVASIFSSDSGGSWNDYKSCRGFTPIHEALLRINDDSSVSLRELLTLWAEDGILSGLIDVPDSFGRSPLAWSVEYGWAEATSTLLEFGANAHQLRYSVSNHAVPLMHLAIAGPDPRRSNLQVLEVVKLLLQANVDVNATDHESWTALHIAASWNLFDVIRSLLEIRRNELDFQLLTNEGKSALDLAVDVGADEQLIHLLQCGAF